MTDVPRWTAHELTFESERTREHPFWDVDLTVELTAPSGRTFTIDSFWDGGQIWRARLRLARRQRRHAVEVRHRPYELVDQVAVGVELHAGGL